MNETTGEIKSAEVLRDGLAHYELPSGGVELLVEAPLILEINGVELVTMRTPGQDEELARGFLMSERVVAAASEILGMEPFTKGGVAGLRVSIPPGRSAQRGRLARVHEIRASCGLCGIPSIDHLAADIAPLRHGWPRLTIAEAVRLAGAMRGLQPLFEVSGGAHAAALARGGELIFVREDVGRHNALDKVIGAALAAAVDFSETILLLSGRGGFELILKALRVGIPVIACISAPTSFAAELATEAGATFIAFTRGPQALVLSDDGRITPS